MTAPRRRAPSTAPPLFKDLFSSEYADVLARHRNVGTIAAQTRLLAEGAIELEAYIRDQLRDASSAHRRRQYFALPFYLQDLLLQASSTYTSHADRDDVLVDEALRVPDVMFATLNYDTLLDGVLASHRPLRTLDDYIGADNTWSLLKLHGSIDWGREIIRDETRPLASVEELCIEIEHGGMRTIPLPGFAVDYVRGSRQPLVMLALSPNQTSVLLGSSYSLTVVTLTTGRVRRLKPPGDPIEQLAWLTADGAVAVTRHAWNSPTRVMLLELGSRRQRVVGETTSLVAPIARSVVVAPTEGGVATFTARGDLLAHVAGADSLILAIPSSSPFVMAVPQADDIGPGRRVVVDARSGTLALDHEFDHAPCYITQIAGHDYG